MKILVIINIINEFRQFKISLKKYVTTPFNYWVLLNFRKKNAKRTSRSVASSNTRKWRATKRFSFVTRRSFVMEKDQVIIFWFFLDVILSFLIFLVFLVFFVWQNLSKLFDKVFKLNKWFVTWFLIRMFDHQDFSAHLW